MIEQNINEFSPPTQGRGARQWQALGSEIAQCEAILAAGSRRLLEQHPVEAIEQLPQRARIGCPGVPGAYTHIACEAIFPHGEVSFFARFDEVVDAVQAGAVDFGVIPVENSSAGPVNQTLELVGERGIYLCAETQIKVEHCLCAHPGTDPAGIRVALSHPQALMQCAGYLEKKGLATESFSNTAAAAKAVGEGVRPETACICSRRSADLYGLRVLERNIQDFDENYTRFLCVARRHVVVAGAKAISLALSLPHQPGALNRLLTRFSFFDLDLLRLRSFPIASRDFGVRFHLDFAGSIFDEAVVSLLSAMSEELSDFHYLGNYHTVE